MNDGEVAIRKILSNGLSCQENSHFYIRTYRIEDVVTSLVTTIAFIIFPSSNYDDLNP